MTSYTPGPWHQSVKTPTTVWSGTKIVSEVIAYCHDNDFSVAEREANARLIAAAPDMVELLADLWVAYADTKEPALSAMADRVRALIAKIEGEA